MPPPETPSILVSGIDLSGIDWSTLDCPLEINNLNDWVWETTTSSTGTSTGTSSQLSIPEHSEPSEVRMEGDLVIDCNNKEIRVSDLDLRLEELENKLDRLIKLQNYLINKYGHKRYIDILKEIDSIDSKE